MSRHLPEKPNLEYLKKQAKELLRGMPQGKLADAQHRLANEYGFATWAKLKSHIESLGLTPAEALKAAVCDSDAARVCEVLERYPELRARIDDPLPDYGFGEHALFAAVQRSDRATIDVLLRAGANIRKRTEWWAGGFGVLDDCDPNLVEFLTQRGAVLDPHSASRLGMMAKLRELVAADPAVVHARGGDGRRRCTSPPRWRLRSSCWRTEPKSMRVTWTTNQRRRTICCAWGRSGTTRGTGRMWHGTWYRGDAGRTS